MRSLRQPLPVTLSPQKSMLITWRATLSLLFTCKCEARGWSAYQRLLLEVIGHRARVGRLEDGHRVRPRARVRRPRDHIVGHGAVAPEPDLEGAVVKQRRVDAATQLVEGVAIRPARARHATALATRPVSRVGRHPPEAGRQAYAFRGLSQFLSACRSQLDRASLPSRLFRLPSLLLLLTPLLFGRDVVKRALGARVQRYAVLHLVGRRALNDVDLAVGRFVEVERPSIVSVSIIRLSVFSSAPLPSRKLTGPARCRKRCRACGQCRRSAGRC